MSTRAETLLKDLSAKIGLPDLSFDEKNMCSLLIDRKYRITLFADTEDSLTLYGLIGMHPNEGDDSFMLDMFALNAAFAKSRGPYLSIELNSKIFLLAKVLELDELDASSLEAQIEFMVENQEYVFKQLEEQNIKLREIA